MNTVYSRRGFFEASFWRAGAVAAAIGLGSSNCGDVYPASGVGVDSAVPVDAGATRDAADTPDPQVSFSSGNIADLADTPAPAGIYVNGDEARVLSSLGHGLPPDVHVFKGVNRFGLAAVDDLSQVAFGDDDHPFLSALEVMPDGTNLVTAAGGFYHGGFHAFPLADEQGTILLSGSPLLTSAGNDHTLWMTVSRFDVPRYLSEQDPFVRSVLLAYPVSSGVIDTAAVNVIDLAGQNPTAMALRGSGASRQLVIVNSGNHLDSASASIDIMNIVGARDVQLANTITFPEGHSLQASSRLAIDSANDAAYVGTLDGSRKVFRVSFAKGEVDGEMQITSPGRHASATLNGAYLYVTALDPQPTAPSPSSINMIEVDGFSQIDDLELQGAGPSAAHGEGVIQPAADEALYVRPVIG